MSMAIWDFPLARGRTLQLGSRPRIASILNCTPDSFSDGGRYAEPADAVRAALKMVSDGADLIDVGGESTRPGSQPVPAAEQLRRVLPVIEGIRSSSDVPISIDTQSPAVADAAFDAGADILNDVSACRDPEMPELLRKREAPVILMHMRGTPADMQQNPEYPEGVVPSVQRFFAERLDSLEAQGVPQERAILDPGIGFGKRWEHNLELLRHLSDLAALHRPVCLGVSRKGFLAKALKREAGGGPDLDPDIGTLIVNALSLQRGAHLLRVHDVPRTVSLVRLYEALREEGGTPGRESA
jgi:dihydropteroate synthase